VPIDLERPEAYLFSFTYNGETFAVSVPGRTEAEARHRFGLMSLMEKRDRIVAGLGRGERDIVADFFGWLAGFLGRRPARRPA
jgi:hypothetical protein